MKICKKCGHTKKLIKMDNTGFNLCMCDWDISKMFRNCTFNEMVKFNTPTLIDEISKLKQLVTISIGHTHTIDIMDDKNRNEMTNRLQKMHRILMTIETN